jgi:glycerophosphoryl diester phosphodiesterase
MNLGLALRSWADLRFAARTVLAFQLLTQLASLAIFAPLLTWLARRLVVLSGEPVISNYAIGTFLLSPAGVGLITLLLFTAGATLVVQFAGQTCIAAAAGARQPPSLAAVVAAVLRRAPALVFVSGRVLLRLLVLAVPFVALALLTWAVLLRGHDVNYYLAAQPPEWQRALVLGASLAVVYGLLALWQLGRWLLALPILMLEGLAPERALAESARCTRHRLAPLLVPLLSWWFLVGVSAQLLVVLAEHLESLGLAWCGVDFARVLPLVTLILAVRLTGTFLLNAALIAGHQFLVTRFYSELLGDRAPRAAPHAAASAGAAQRLFSEALLVTAAMLVAALATMWWVAARGTPAAAVAITAHRGYAAQAPENSLAAFRAALLAHADYSELDVQRTRDGEVVVLHDADLMRMAGDPRRVAALTLPELASIDIGRRAGTAYAGEHVPTLAEVIALVRGRMRLNVELKYNVPDRQLAAAVVAVLEREQFVDQVVITSLDAAALRQVRQLEPRLRIGQIVTFAVGDVARADTDFVSLNAARTDPAVIRRVHDAGKSLHVWTVNKAEAMLRLMELGADNLITDDPALAVRLRDERGSLSAAEVLALRLRVLFSAPPPELVDPRAVPAL